jgi:hypothetical protein
MLRGMRWARCIACMRDKNAYNILVFEGKRLLGRHKYRWEVNTELDPKEI